MTEELFKVLWKEWEKREQNEWVFYNPKTETRYLRRPKLIKSLCKKAGIDPPITWHDFRHFMASYLADSQKVSKKTISHILRHRALGTTEIYLHSMDESVRAAMNNVDGLFSRLNGDQAKKRVDKK